MTLYGTLDAIMCRPFPMTLRGIVRGWYDWLPPSFIHSFDQLAREFDANFLSNAQPKPTAASLLGMSEQTVPRSPNISLNSTRTEIFLQIREKGLLKAPNLMRYRDEDWDHRRYYHFHSNYGHDTEEWYDLKNQIKDLICRDHLDQYIWKPRKPSLYPKGPVERQVDFIVGGPTTGGVSSLARKAYARTKVH
ncbi:hypothetical protein B296_00010981 [Ensete ventricosum]|uniref:Retrotransposon gag domain-containing protein n=1 Tax=Ensete ventricosum TaxID=4639 RepID=A0A426Z4J4_ENSVE|nr:hypothetical protein B296_00010981 [Ensete ventricosum]